MVAMYAGLRCGTSHSGRHRAAAQLARRWASSRAPRFRRDTHRCRPATADISTSRN